MQNARKVSKYKRNRNFLILDITIYNKNRFINIWNPANAKKLAKTGRYE